jgi:hypothetical protein
MLSPGGNSRDRKKLKIFTIFQIFPTYTVHCVSVRRHRANSMVVIQDGANERQHFAEMVLKRPIFKPEKLIYLNARKYPGNGPQGQEEGGDS